MPSVSRSKPVQLFRLRAHFGSVEWRPTRFLRMGLVLDDDVGRWRCLTLVVARWRLRYVLWVAFSRVVVFALWRRVDWERAAIALIVGARWVRRTLW